MSNAAQLPPDWHSVLGPELERPYFKELGEFVAAERAQETVFPAEEDVFCAFHATPYARMRVLILGQDPYHDVGQAHGLCFSVKPGVRPPPSLVNIYKELAADVGCETPSSGCLLPWAKQGVLLLNAVLTVRAHQANSHKGRGWEEFTDAVIRRVNDKTEHVVFVLWGGYARKKAPLIDASRHTLVEGPHPSPLSARLWFGSRPFSQINAALRKHEQPAIEWQIEGSPWET